MVEPTDMRDRCRIGSRPPTGRVIHTRHAGQRWRVVVEPDPDDKILMIVTAYPEEVLS